MPGFAHLSGELFYAAVAGAPDDPAATVYLDSVLDFAGGTDERLESLRRHRGRNGSYPTTEAGVLRAHAPKNGRVSEADGLRLVLWACDELEAQVSGLDRLREAEEEPAGTS